MSKSWHSSGLAFVLFVAAGSSFIACSSKGRSESTSLPLYERVLLGEASVAETANMQRTVEAHRIKFVVDCMKASGFTLFAPDPASTMQVYSGPERSSIDFARRYGFGVSTDPAPAAGSQDPADERNKKYIAGLSPQAQNAYGQASTECDSKSSDLAKTNPELAAIQSRFDELSSRLRSSPEYSRLVRVWQVCAQGVGVRSDGLDQLIDSFAQRVGSATSGGGSANLQALQKEEVQTAVATHDCNAAYTEGYYREYERLWNAGR